MLDILGDGNLGDETVLEDVLGILPVSALLNPPRVDKLDGGLTGGHGASSDSRVGHEPIFGGVLRTAEGTLAHRPVTVHIPVIGGARALEAAIRVGALGIGGAAPREGHRLARHRLKGTLVHIYHTKALFSAWDNRLSAKVINYI